MQEFYLTIRVMKHWAYMAMVALGLWIRAILQIHIIVWCFLLEKSGQQFGEYHHNIDAIQAAIAV